MIVPGDIAGIDFGLVHSDGTRPCFMVAMTVAGTSEDGTHLLCMTFIQAREHRSFRLVQCYCFCDDEEMKTIVPGTRRIRDGAA